MEANRIRIGTRRTGSRPGALAGLRYGIRLRRLERARRAHALRVNGARAPYVSGSEHAHMLRPPKAF
jgi:hypothetical protein